MRGTTIKTLKEIGLKVTPQRQAILRLLEGNETHPFCNFKGVCTDCTGKR